MSRSRRRPTAVLLFVLAAGCRPERAADVTADNADRSRPNVVLVTIDTLRADRLALLGGTIPTPALERLAREGAVFEHAVSPVPFTLASHSSIFTGLYPRTHGVQENVGYRLRPEIPTLAESLRAAGYRTGAFVSAFVLDRRFGLGRGFETYADDFSAGDLTAGNLASLQRPGFETVERALEWIRSLSNGALFFVWVHLYEPHDPYEPPEPYRSLFPDDPYAGEVATADACLGRLIDGVGSREPISWIVTGDHGESLGDHGEAFHGYFVYDATVRVPLIFAGAGVEARGRRWAEPVSLVDLLPTLADLVGFAPPPHQGRSLAPELAGRSAGPQAVFTASSWPRTRYGFAAPRAVVLDRWKYVEAPRPELYDLIRDPQERYDEAGNEPRRVRDLHRTLARWLEGSEPAAAANPVAAEDAAEDTAALRSLGYTGASPKRGDEARRIDPKDGIETHRRVMLAESALDEGHVADAAERLEAALAEDPDLPIAHLLLGQALLREGRYDDAEASFRRVLELDPEFQPAVFGLAAAYAARGQLEAARAGFVRALALDPGDRRAVLALADVLERSGDAAPAQAVLRGAIEPDRRATGLMSRLADLLLAAGQDAEAAQWLERAGELDPRPEAGLRLAAAYERLGRDEDQRRVLEDLVAGSPELAEPRVLLGKWLMDHGGDLDRAEDLVREALAMEPGALGYFVLADLLNRRGRTREAQEAVRQGRSAAAGAPARP